MEQDLSRSRAKQTMDLIRSGKGRLVIKFLRELGSTSGNERPSATETLGHMAVNHPEYLDMLPTPMPESMRIDMEGEEEKATTMPEQDYYALNTQTKLFGTLLDGTGRPDLGRDEFPNLPSKRFQRPGDAEALEQEVSRVRG